MARDKTSAGDGKGKTATQNNNAAGNKKGTHAPRAVGWSLFLA